MSNMEIWNKHKTPPPDALKNIGGGRLGGMTDINPQWRYEAMTKAFGMCGIGWKYEIIETPQMETIEDQVIQFARINLYVKVNDKWSDAIPAVGGNMLVEKEYKGLHVNDEAVKMAVTDALGNAMKMLGVAADIYRGYTPTKYNKPAKTTTVNKVKKAVESPEKEPVNSDPKVKLVKDIMCDEPKKKLWSLTKHIHKGKVEVLAKWLKDKSITSKDLHSLTLPELKEVLNKADIIISEERVGE